MFNLFRGKNPKDCLIDSVVFYDAKRQADRLSGNPDRWVKILRMFWLGDNGIETGHAVVVFQFGFKMVVHDADRGGSWTLCHRVERDPLALAILWMPGRKFTRVLFFEEYP